LRRNAGRPRPATAKALFQGSTGIGDQSYTNEFAAEAKKFVAYCAARPAASLMMAADEIFAD
jgi:hypothetical protein